jgi:8-oxo-dGTP pyrophosphatase MutT (NUDIX family)
MQKFTTALKSKKVEEKPVITHEDGVLKVMHYKDWTITSEKDMIIVLPYFPEEGYILLRSEYIPTYQWSYREMYKNTDNFLTILSGGIEEGETPENAIRRELIEESGLIISNMTQIEIDSPLHISKGSLTKYYPCLLELRYNDFKQTAAVGDGSLSEKLSNTIKVSIADIDDLICHDLITQYMLLKLKNEYDLK